jgi:hypothetical protein
MKVVGKTSGSHGGKYEDECLAGFCAIYSGRGLPTFQRRLLPPSSGRFYQLQDATAHKIVIVNRDHNSVIFSVIFLPIFSCFKKVNLLDFKHFRRGIL